MDWYDITDRAHQRTLAHDGRLTALPTEWDRELAALWRLEADVNNGAYLQFLSNLGRESYAYASQALTKIGARKMAEIIDRCQALVDEHFQSEGASSEQLAALMPNAVMGRDGRLVRPGLSCPRPCSIGSMTCRTSSWITRTTSPDLDFRTISRS